MRCGMAPRQRIYRCVCAAGWTMASVCAAMQSVVCVHHCSMGTAHVLELQCPASMQDVGHDGMWGTVHGGAYTFLCLRKSGLDAGKHHA